MSTTSDRKTFRLGETILDRTGPVPTARTEAKNNKNRGPNYTRLATWLGITTLAVLGAKEAATTVVSGVEGGSANIAALVSDAGNKASKLANNVDNSIMGPADQYVENNEKASQEAAKKAQAVENYIHSQGQNPNSTP